MLYDTAPLYIWQQPDWPHWRFDVAALAEPLARGVLRKLEGGGRSTGYELSK